MLTQHGPHAINKLDQTLFGFNPNMKKLLDTPEEDIFLAWIEKYKEVSGIKSMRVCTMYFPCYQYMLNTIRGR